MVDVNRIVRDILSSAIDEKIVFYGPQEVNALPVVSYFELSTTTGSCYDNKEMAQSSSVQIDVWSKSGAECADIAVRIDSAMQDKGWYRSLCMDLPAESGSVVTANTKAYRKTMRYKKQIILDMEE